MRTLIIGVVVFATLGFVNAKTDEYSDTLRIIHKKCAEEWPDDFNRRANCEQRQQEGLEKLRRLNPRNDKGQGE